MQARVLEPAAPSLHLAPCTLPGPQGRPTQVQVEAEGISLPHTPSAPQEHPLQAAVLQPAAPLPSRLQQSATPHPHTHPVETGIATRNLPDPGSSRTHTARMLPNTLSSCSTVVPCIS